MSDVLLSAIYYSAAVGVVSCLISESKIMAPVRDRLNWPVLFCPICLGFWLAAPALWSGLFFYFAVVGCSNVWMLIILHTYEALDRTYESQETAKEDSPTSDA